MGCSYFTLMNHSADHMYKFETRKYHEGRGIHFNVPSRTPLSTCIRIMIMTFTAKSTEQGN